MLLHDPYKMGGFRKLPWVMQTSKRGKGSVVGASKESQGVESLGIGRKILSHAAGMLPNRLEMGTKGCMAGTKQCTWLSSWPA